MKWYIKTVILIIVIIGYLVFINNVGLLFDKMTEVVQENYTATSPSSSPQGEKVRIGFIEHVDVSVMRPRWYGTIYETEGEGILYLFDVIKIPLRTYGVNLLYMHMSFVVIIFLTIYLMIILDREKKEVIMENERMGQDIP